MNSRQRVINTFQFKTTDRPPFDLMEGCVWPELLEYFRQEYGYENESQVIEFLNPDFRWVFPAYIGPNVEETTQPPSDADKSRSKDTSKGLLSGASTIAEVERYPRANPDWWGPGDLASARKTWPGHAIVFCPGWSPLFWGACEAFGLEEAMVNLLTAPHLIEAYISGQHQFNLRLISRCIDAAGLYCDVCWLGDDFASQSAMMIKPNLWRKYIKPYLAEEVSLVRSHGLPVLFHSCGAVRPVLPDLIEIGVNALEVFQTSAYGMDPTSIAHDFGGKMVFYGGIDVQKVLSFGNTHDVEIAIDEISSAFQPYGGYVIANSHHSIPSIKGENILAMCKKASRIA
jgi:uroporphyrinogen decarboxylase